MVQDILNRLLKSKFRNSFRLKRKDKEYIKNKGLDTIREHAYTFIKQRLASKTIENDGKQTPFKGHPVFIAQHACACCCRTCLYKWHKISMDIELNESQIEYIVNLLMGWINKELSIN